MTEQPPRALVVAAHPDDIDFGSGATVAFLVGSGWAVSYCLVTDGDAGGFDPSVPREQMGAIRRAEQTEAARILGVSDIHWLGYPDGRLEVTLELRRDLSRVIRTVRPSRVLCQNPNRNFTSIYGSHPDHLAAGEATLCAVYPDARNPFAFPELAGEGLGAHSVEEVWVGGGPDPDVVLDVGEHLGAKLAALRAHVSQETDRDGRLEPMIREWMGRTAAAAGMPEGTLAEAYRRIDTR
ncbi:MAG: PIG-L family deacetylase [Actinomycetota bacterium]|nr:PIG-L family deacetylase [Actinomycetota bacterium]